MKESFKAIAVAALVLAASCAFAQGSKPSWQVEWEKTVELGKKILADFLRSKADVTNWPSPNGLIHWRPD